MKVAFPTQEDRGIDSPVYGHFGSAAAFVIAETGSDKVDRVVNEDAVHQHGMCNPLAALGGQPVDAIVVGGIGAGALMKLQAAGVRVYRAMEGSVRENLEMIDAGRLPELTIDQTCAGHQGGEGCSH